MAESAVWAIPKPEDARSATNDAGRWALLVSRAGMAVRRAVVTGRLSSADGVVLRTLSQSLEQALGTLAYLDDPSAPRPAGRLGPVDVAVRTVREQVSQAGAPGEASISQDATEAIRRFHDRVTTVLEQPATADERLAEALEAIAAEAAAEAGTTGDSLATF